MVYEAAVELKFVLVNMWIPDTLIVEARAIQHLWICVKALKCSWVMAHAQGKMSRASDVNACEL